MKTYLSKINLTSQNALYFAYILLGMFFVLLGFYYIYVSVRDFGTARNNAAPEAILPAQEGRVGLFEEATRKKSPDKETVPPQESQPVGDPAPNTDLERFHPTTDRFIQDMSSWKKKARDLLGRAAPTSNSYIIQYHAGNREITIELTARAHDRVLSDDLGGQKRDKAIYLQWLINEECSNLFVDGWFGDDSRNALRQCLAGQLTNDQMENLIEEIDDFF